MQRIHNQVASASIKTGSLDSSASSESTPVVPLRLRRASHNSPGPGSSQIPVKPSKHYKDAPLPSLSISIPPMPSRPLALAIRDEVPEQQQPPPRKDQARTPALRQQSMGEGDRVDAAKMVTFAADHDEDDLSDQTSICHSPTWDNRKKKKTKPSKPTKAEPSPIDNGADGSASPTKKKGRRLSKQPPTPGPQVRSVTKAERNTSAPRFDLDDIETQAPQNKAMRNRPPDAMKHPELHQSGNVSDSNDKPRSKGFFSRIRRLSFDGGSKSPETPPEPVAPPPLVRKAHSSGPGTGLGFFSSRKPQTKDTSKTSTPRSQSSTGSHPPVTSRPSGGETHGRSNSLLAATIDKIMGNGPKAAAASVDEDKTKPQSQSEPSTRKASATQPDELDGGMPYDLKPPAANFSQKPRSYSSDSLTSQDTRPDSKHSERSAIRSATPHDQLYQSTDVEDESEFGSLSTLRLPQNEVALRSARSSIFETASIQESIFNVVKLEDRSSDYLNFINDSYTPPLLELVTPVEGRSSPLRSTPKVQPSEAGIRTQDQRSTTAPPRDEKEVRIEAPTAQRAPVSNTDRGQTSSPSVPSKQAPAPEQSGQSWSARLEASVSRMSNLSAPAPFATSKLHSRTASEKSSSSLYDESTPTPSTPATPDSIQPQRRQDVHPALRAASWSQAAKEEGSQPGSSADRPPRNETRKFSLATTQETPDRSASREPRPSEDSGSRTPSTLDLDPPPANFFSRVDANGSSSSLASSPTSIKSTSALKGDSALSSKQDKKKDRDMPPRAQSAIDLSSTSFLPPLKHQPLMSKKQQKSMSVVPPLTPPESADDESSSLRPKTTRHSSVESGEPAGASPVGGAYLEEARRAVQPMSAARAMKPPFSHKNSSTPSIKTAQGGRAEPIAKMLVECCGCKFFHDMPSKVYECMAKPDSIVEDKRLGVSAAVTTMVRCPWCGHGMSTQCCSGYAAVLFLKEKLHGK